MIKIIPTIGPITNEIKNLKVLSKYSNIFRLNASHNDINWHKKTLQNILKLKKNIKILVDIPGVKPRTKNNKNINIKKNSIVIFYNNEKPKVKFKRSVFILLSNPIPQNNIFKKNNILSVEDGKYLFKIKKFTKKYIVTTAERSLVLKPNKGVNIPNSIYDNNLQEKKYLQFLKKLEKFEYHAIGLSFIQDHKLIIKLKKKYPDKLIISKIENLEGVRNMFLICFHSDVIMIDRGDLAAEIGNEKLFETILKISQICKSLSKPLMIATENLDSMINNQAPTKSEIFTLGYYKEINVDSIMLSDETATSLNWKNTIKWIYKFFNDLKKDQKKKFKNDENFWSLLRNDLKLPLIIFTKRGESINNVEKLSYFNEVNVFTENKKIKTLYEFKKNINVFLTRRFDNKNLLKFIKTNINKFSKSIFKSNDQIIVIYISYPRKNSRANTMMLLNKKDFL